jgi:hypothetical protein
MVGRKKRGTTGEEKEKKKLGEEWGRVEKKRGTAGGVGGERSWGKKNEGGEKRGKRGVGEEGKNEGGLNRKEKGWG